MSELRFEDPPKRPVGRHVAAAAELREHPGQWARVSTYTRQGTACSTAFRIRAGRWSTWAPAGAYEATARTVTLSDGTVEYQVYARFVGGEGQ